MKRKSIEPEAPAEAAETSLYEALLTLRDEAEMQAFFHDLCTPAELEALQQQILDKLATLPGKAAREVITGEFQKILAVRAA
mgnify:CR=1 FL=1